MLAHLTWKQNLLTLWRARQLCFFYVQILPERKNRFVFYEVNLICWGIIKVKILYKISGMKFSSLELKLSVCAVQTPPLKGLKYRRLKDFCNRILLTQMPKKTLRYFKFLLTLTGAGSKDICITFYFIKRVDVHNRGVACYVNWGIVYSPLFSYKCLW